jgi:uncharacterized protein (TIGR03118 family)
MTAIQDCKCRTLVIWTAALGIVSTSPSTWAAGGHQGGSENQRRFNHYQQLNLVSDLPDVAVLQDPDLVNAWGMSFTPTSPFWISDNGAGVSTLYAVTYDVAGLVNVAKVPRTITIPGQGNPSGQFFNGAAGFNGDLFVFASEDGTISGWRPALGSAAEILTANPDAVYKGATRSNDGLLLAANFSRATVDVYDGSLTPIAQFSDSQAPAGYAPFNVQNVAGTVLVTFAKQDDAHEDDVPGGGHGLIDIFHPQTGTFTRFATGSDAGGSLRQINSPWGLALAPSTFGKHARQLLVGNFGSGTIMTFDPETGAFRGLLMSTEDGPAVIDGLWALGFGNGGMAGRPGTLYFTAGPDHESHGLFGSLDPVRDDGNNEGDDD